MKTKGLPLWSLILAGVILLLNRLAPDFQLLRYAVAALPIVLVLGVMIFLRWGIQRAGSAGWLAGLIVATLAFGLTPQVLWVSQVKGVLLALYVLAVLYPALLLYNIVNQSGGICALPEGLECAIADRGLLLVVVAWAFSGMLEGLAGFGLPIAIVAPILVGMRVEPITAIAAVAVGHAWSVTFGDMGVIFQTLTAVTKMDGALLAPSAALMLGLACLACGLAAARILGQQRCWPRIVGLALLMGVTQYVLAVSGLAPLGALGAGLVGVVGGIILGRQPNPQSLSAPRIPGYPVGNPAANPALGSALFSYGSLALLMAGITLIVPLRDTLNAVVWQPFFPEVTTLAGVVTPAGSGQAFRFLTHPGASILLIAVLSYALNRRLKHCAPHSWRSAVAATWRSALPSTVGILTMVGLSTLMDHCGMTLLLARALCDTMGAAYPLLSPSVGILGAFATGSNNNSNVLFGTLQKNAALLLAMDPRILIAAQTAGGALGSMIAPAKIVVGSSTLGIRDRDGDILRRTVPYGLVIGLILGGLTLLLAR